MFLKSVVRGGMWERSNFNSVISCRCRSFSSPESRSARNDIKIGDISDKRVAQSCPSEPPLKIVKPLIFAVAFSSASFAGAAVWQYENMRSRAKELTRLPQTWLFDRVPSNFRIREKFGSNFRIRIEKQGSFRQVCNTFWNSLSEAHKIFLPILFINVLVYAAWKVPHLRPTMMAYFVSSPAAKRVCWPMFLSTFSHINLFHLLANMFALNSFMTAIVPFLGIEQFVAFYLSAGVIASIFSHLFRVITRDMAMSIGASGAIMGAIGYACVKHPDTLLSVVFIPFLAFKASSGLKVIMAVDFTCLLMKFRFFDHAAHLGGALFGIFWCLWGNEHIWQQRGPLLEYWHKIRNSPSKS